MVAVPSDAVGPFDASVRPHRTGVYLRCYSEHIRPPDYSRWDGSMWRSAVTKVGMASMMRVASVHQSDGFVWYGLQRDDRT